jgi:sulfite exporter TauE/SafE
MACFGLGTAPAVLSIGSLSSGLRSAIKNPLTRFGFASILILLALYPLYTISSHSREHGQTMRNHHNHSTAP